MYTTSYITTHIEHIVYLLNQHIRNLLSNSGIKHSYGSGYNGYVPLREGIHGTECGYWRRETGRGGHSVYIHDNTIHHYYRLDYFLKEEGRGGIVFWWTVLETNATPNTPYRERETTIKRSHNTILIIVAGILCADGRRQDRTNLCSILSATVGASKRLPSDIYLISCILRTINVSYVHLSFIKFEQNLFIYLFIDRQRPSEPLNGCHPIYI